MSRIHTTAIAHLKINEKGVSESHTLREHLQGVAEKASTFADEFGNADWARVAGLWHDLGKYNPKWQEYLRKSNGDYQENSDGEN